MTSSSPSEAVVCELTLPIGGMSCAACQAHVQRALESVPGVVSAEVDLLGKQAHLTSVTPLEEQALTEAIRKAGYDVLTPTPNASIPASQTPGILEDASQHRLGLRALGSLLAGAIAMALSMPLMSSMDGPDRLSAALMRISTSLLPSTLLYTAALPLCWVLLILTLATMLFAAPEIYRAAWRAARHRSTNMNTLVALGTLIAFAASSYTTLSLSIGRMGKNFSDVYFESVIFILAFLLAGRWLEARARLRATASLRLLAQQESGNARWIAESSPETLALDPVSLLSAPETLLPLDAILVGDLLRVLPGDRIPLDGIVLAGRSSVDESALTGESLPVTREPGTKLWSGTLNLDGPLLLRATAIGADSMQAQMARLLERARATRAPLQRLADRVSAVFVPCILILATITFLAWAILDNTGGSHLGYGRALSLTIAVLVVACPCAMGLAVPAAVAVSLGTAARAGILIKGGEALERLASIDTVALDKTGTLTEGRPSIAAFVPANTDIDSATLLAWAAALEAAATHPLAEAIRVYATQQGASPTPVLRNARILPGLGAEADLEDLPLRLGNAALLPTTTPAPLPPAGLGHATPMYLVAGDQLQATFYATDTLRPSAQPALDALTQDRIDTVLLTGDIAASAASISRQLGITQVQASLLPADKLSAIATLRQRGRRVAMVGDGLNDAPALAHADAGIAMASGTDLAREAGHVLLLHHDLRLVPATLRLARRTRRLMRQNLAWALLYNVLGIPLAAGVLLPRFGLRLSPALASAAMALSSVSVLLNSLRLATPLRSASEGNIGRPASYTQP